MNAASIAEATYHVGNEQDFFADEEESVVFNREPGRVRFPFGVVDLSSGGGGVAHHVSVLLFQTRNVNGRHNMVRLNGRDLGTLRPAVQSWEDKRSWSANVRLVHTDLLRDGDNELVFEARDASGRPWPEGDIDDFLVSDVAILYPTTGEGTRRLVDGAGAVQTELAGVVRRLENLERAAQRAGDAGRSERR